jgi:hypothetical protein
MDQLFVIGSLAGVGRADEEWIEVKRFGLYEAVGRGLPG